MRPNQAAASAPDRPLGLADELYIGSVDEMLVEVKWLLTYGAAITLTGAIVAIETRSAALWVYAGLILLSTLVRLAIMRWHAKNKPSKSLAIARKHEQAYALGVVSFMAVLSTWTLTAFWVTDDAFARLLTFSATVAYTFGMLARSFAIDKGQNAQIAVGFVPLSAAMIVAGGLYPLLIVILIAPLFASIKASSVRLKDVFRREVEARSQAAMLAERLDTALNNMPHGLGMFDNTGHLILVNAQFPRLLALEQGSLAACANARELLLRLVKIGLVDGARLPDLAAALLRNASDSQDIVVPVETMDGRAIEVTVHRMPGKGAVVIVQDVTARRNAERAIDHMAHFDAVTDLPNRRYFEEKLAEALANGQAADDPVTVMFLDVDDFKQVNDSLGHSSGDALLVEIANRLRKIVGERGVVARWGGDEFTILLRSSAAQGGLEELVGRILKEAERPVAIGDGEVIVGVSIGSATAPADGESAETILSKADMALYSAKAEGRRGWRAFETYMDARVHIRRLIELDLRAAVANDAIELHYQPIINVTTSKVVSFEALARWVHPVRGRLSPAEFIPVVEALGLMNEMGANLLKRACLACASWPENIKVSVNVSATQFKTGKLVQTVQDALRGANLPANRLEIEITESALLDDNGTAGAILQTLRSLGVRVSLDDFGTGYSSLSYLLSFPLDRIKIDRSFTVGLGVHERSSILVESVAVMSAKLKMSVLIEGVETERQLDLIERLGTISEVQGYLFSPALPEAEIGKFLSQRLQRRAA